MSITGGETPVATRPLAHPPISTPPAVDVGCPICDARRRSYLFVVRGLPIVECPGCGLLSLNPPPSIEDVDAFYTNVTYTNATREQDPRLFWTDTATERKAACRYLEALRDRHVGDGPFLLIAPPEHAFAREARSRGYQLASHVSIVDVEAGVDLGSDYAAVVVLYQLEKSTDPATTLRTIHSALRPGGHLLLTTPSLDSWSAHFFGEHWTEWRPENRFYFSRNTVHSVLLKTGFDEVWMGSDRRLYTLRHVYARATAFPRTLLTRAIASLYPKVPFPLRDARIRLDSSGMIVTARRSEPRARPRCSIIVPVYNERQTFPILMDGLLARTIRGLDREIIVVESNSSDGTREVAERYHQPPEIRVVLQAKARGKGNAVRAGFAECTGDIVMIQDADLEYDLNDYEQLLEPLLTYRSPFVLGTRHGGSWKIREFSDQQGLTALFNAGHIFFTTLINVLYGQNMRDPFTMYKVFRYDCLYGLQFECNRFDFDFELVIKLIRKGYRPLEIPVNYRSRSFREGKKVRMWRDPLTWLWAAFKYRLGPLPRRPREWP